MNNQLSEKEKFFSKVSHDLRGSFTSILGFSDILNDTDENLSTEEISEYVERIGKQSHESFELLVNFINWLKLEDYQYGLTIEKLDVIEVIHEINQHYKKELSKKNVSLSIEINDSIYVQMDYEILTTILKNVVHFLLKICCNDSKLEIFTQKLENKLITIKVSSECVQNESIFLQNINLKDLNSELSFPIIFANKFTELSGGQFQFIYDNNNILIDIKLPSN